VEEVKRPITIRFTTRKMRKTGRRVEVANFYSSTSSRIFHARCERGVISGFLERINAPVRRSKTGKTIYLEGERAEELLRKLVILAGCRQSIKVASKMLEVAGVVASFGEFETIFWYSKMIEGYEKRGFWGVCRVARAFRTLYRTD